MKIPLNAAAAIEVSVEDTEADGRAESDGSEPSIVARLFRSHGSKLRRFLSYRLHDQEEARDTSQDVFLKLWRYELQGSLRDDAKSYMYTATHSAATDVARSRVARGYGLEAGVDADTLPAGEIGLDERMYWREALAHFVSCVRALPETTANVFLLYYVDGMTYPQVAKTLQISQRTAERHLIKALAELREKMKDFL